jgi:hypothetical protein
MISSIPVKKILLVGFGFVFAFLITETAFRLQDQFAPAEESWPAIFDAEIGNRLPPNSRGVFTMEGFSEWSTNSAGWLDKERSFNKSPDTYRVVVIGDSFVEALQVAKSESFTSVAEELLTACPVAGQSFEILPMGVAGWGTAQAYLTAKNEAILYDPNLVIMAFYTNDLRNNVLKYQQDLHRPYYSLIDGELELTHEPLPIESDKTQKPFFDSSGAISQASTLRKIYRSVVFQSHALQKLRSSIHEFADFNSEGLRVQMSLAYKIDSDELDDEEAWKLTEALLQETYDFLANRQVDAGLLVVSTGFAVHPEQSTVDEWISTNGIVDPLYPENRLSRFGEEINVPVIPIAREMLARNAQADKPIFYHGFDNTSMGSGHWNVEGNRLAGEMLADFVCTTAGSPTR